jgi:WD40 repeat protein
MHERNGDLSDPLRGFIEASLIHRERRQNEQEAQRQRELRQAQALAQAEHKRAETEARTGKRLRWLVIGATLAFIVALIAAGYAFQSRLVAERERVRAENNARLALSRQLSAQALRNLESQIDLALLLGLESTRFESQPDVEANLLTEMSIPPLIEKVLHGPSSPIFDMTFSPDGQSLFSTDDKGNVLIWPLYEADTKPSIFIRQDGQIKGVALSRNGDRMAVNRGHSVVLWDLATQQILTHLRDHKERVVRIAFSHDGTRLITVDESSVMFIRDARTGTILTSPLTTDTNQPISADGKTFVRVDSDTKLQPVVFWNSETDESHFDPTDGHTDVVHGFDFSPNLTTLATASFDGSIGRWNVETGKRLGGALHGHDGRVLTVGFSPDGRSLISGGTDNRLLLWDLDEEPQIGLRLRGHNNWVRAIAFSPDGRTLASADADGKVILWRMNRQRMTGHTNRVRTVTLSPDGQTLVTASFDRQIGIWDAPSAQLKQMIATPHERSILNAKFSPDGATLVTVDAGGAVIFWDTTRWEPRFPLRQLQDMVLIGLAFSADGRMLATGAFTGHIHLWDVSRGELMGQPIEGHVGWALSLAFSPKGDLLASGSTDSSLKLWDLSTRQMRGESLAGHTNWVTDLLFTPDGETLISASSDHTIRIWDVTSGQAMGDPLLGHNSQVWALDFFPPQSDQILVSLGGDGSLLRWDWRTRQPLGPPLRAEIETESMALSPDGAYVYLGTFDSTAQRWDLHWDPWQARACQIANRNLTADEWRIYLHDLPYQASCGEER